MPTLPATDGLPVWAQVLVSVLVCIATLAVAFKGYFGKSAVPTDALPEAKVTAGVLLDNLSIRMLSDQLSHLSNDVVSLERAIGDNTHWVRSKFEQDREVCQRLRELRDALEAAAKRDERDEERRAAGRRID